LSPHSEKKEQGSCQQLLVVDDEQNVLNSLTRCFLDTPFHVVTAISAQAALKLLEDGMQPRLIISDYRMPGINGVEFLQQVLQRWPAIKRVILSAYTDTDILLSAVNQGRVHRFLTKPWKNETLLAIIQELLSEADALTMVKQEVEELVRRNQVLASTNDQLNTLLNNLLKTVRSENTAQPDVGQLATNLSDEIFALRSLSKREQQILRCLALGQRPKEIALDQGISIKTVSTYKLRLCEKMKFKNDSQLVAFAIRHRIIPQT